LWGLNQICRYNKIGCRSKNTCVRKLKYVLLQLSQIFLNKNNATYLHCANQCSIGKVDMPYVVEDFSNFLSKMALKSTLLVSTPVTIDTGLPYLALHFSQEIVCQNIWQAPRTSWNKFCFVPEFLSLLSRSPICTTGVCLWPATLGRSSTYL
jgi:hypothetical protein